MSSLNHSQEHLSRSLVFITSVINSMVDLQVVPKFDEEMQRSVNNVLVSLNQGNTLFSKKVNVFHAFLILLPLGSHESPYAAIGGTNFLTKILIQMRQQNCTHEEYLACLKFLSSYARTEYGASTLYSMKVFDTFAHSPIFKDLPTSSEYATATRSATHIVWLRTIHFVRKMAELLVHHPGKIHGFLSFITKFGQRITSTLQFKGYEVLSKEQPFTLAYLEEVEHTTGLVTYLCNNIVEWKSHNRNMYEQFQKVLFSQTIRLFQSNNDPSQIFLSRSTFEHNLNSFDSNMSPQGETDHHSSKPKFVTSTRTPHKFEKQFKHGLYSSLQPREHELRRETSKTYESYLIKHYNPSAFLFQVELTMNNILLYLQRSLFYILGDELKSGKRTQFLEDLCFRQTEQGDYFYTLFSTGVADGVKFGLHCLNKWLANSEKVESLCSILESSYQDELTGFYIGGLSISELLLMSNRASETGLLILYQTQKALLLNDSSRDGHITTMVEDLCKECKTLTNEREMYAHNKEARKTGPAKPKELKMKKTNAETILDRMRELM